MGFERARDLLGIAILLGLIVERARMMCETEFSKERVGAKMAWSIGPTQAGMMNLYGEVFIMTMTSDEKMSSRVKLMNFNISEIGVINSSAGDTSTTFLCDSSKNCIIATRNGNKVNRAEKSIFKYSNSQVNIIKDAVRIDSQFYGLLFENFIVVVDTTKALLTGFEKGAQSPQANIYSADSIHGMCTRGNDDGILFYVKNWTLCNHRPSIPDSESCFDFSLEIDIMSQLSGQPHQPLGCDISASENQAVIGSYYGVIVINLSDNYVRLLEIDGGAGYPKFFTNKADSIEYLTFITSKNELARAKYTLRSSSPTILNSIRFHSHSINQNYQIEKVPETADSTLYFGKVGTEGLFTFQITSNPGQLDLFGAEVDTSTFRQVSEEIFEYQFIGRSIGVQVTREDGSIIGLRNYVAPPLQFNPSNGYDYIYRVGDEFKVWDDITGTGSLIGSTSEDCYGGINKSPFVAFTFNQGVYIGVTGYESGGSKGQRILSMDTSNKCSVSFRNKPSDSDYIPRALLVGKFGAYEFMFTFLQTKILILKGLGNGLFPYSSSYEKTFLLNSDDKVGKVQIITETSLIVNINEYRTDVFTLYPHNSTMVRTKSFFDKITQLMFLNKSLEYWLIGENIMRFNKDFDESTAFTFTSQLVPGSKFVITYSGNSTIVIMSPTGFSSIVFHESWLCLKCHPDCRTCSGLTSSQCLNCDTTLFTFDQLTSRCRRICAAGKFVNDDNKCEDCYEHCTQCIGPGKTQCTSCAANYELDFSNSCSIPCAEVAEFREMESNSCQRCAPTCRHCRGPNVNDCEDCYEGFELVDSMCFGICQSDYYRKPAPDYQCSKCNELCSECTGPAVTDCSSCQLSATLIVEESYCQPKCLEGFYPLEDKCVKCHSSCKWCKDGTENGCIRCFNNYRLLDSGSCLCDTENGYFLEDDSCIRCHSSCKKCTQSSMFDCVECNPNFFTYEPIIDLDGGAYKCRSECPKNSFTDVDLRKCTECHESCQECNGPLDTDCKSCKIGTLYIRDIQSCVEKCPSIKYAISEDGLTCDRCGAYCQECQNFNPSSCIECEPQSFLYRGACYTRCPIGTRPDTSLSSKTTCVKCQRNCRVCESSKCQECETNYLLVDGDCMTFCPTGYIFDALKHICQKIICMENCDICATSTTCAKCKEKSMADIIVLEIEKKCFECVESNGLVQVGESCQELCGDGFLYKLGNSTHQCDDGNIRDGDGCNDQCQIERGYTCTREHSLNSETMDIRDLCQLITKGTIHRNLTVQAQVIFYLDFNIDVIVNPLRISTNYRLNYTSDEGNITVVFEYEIIRTSSRQYSLILDNEVLISSKEDFKGTISLVQYKEILNDELLRDSNGYVVDMTSLTSDFTLQVANLRSEIKIKNIETDTKSLVSSLMIQTILAFLILNPIVYDIAVNVLLKLIYIRVTDIKLPPVFYSFMSVICSSLEFNPGKTDFENTNKNQVSYIDNLFGLKLQDFETLPKFQNIGMSRLFVKSGLPLLTIGVLLYLISMIVEIFYNSLTGLFINQHTGDTKRLWRKKHWMWRELLEFLAINLVWRRVVLWFFGIIPRLTLSLFLDLREFSFDTPANMVSSIFSILTLLLLLPLTIGLISTSLTFFSTVSLLDTSLTANSPISFLLPFKPSSRLSPYYLPLRYIMRPVLLSLTHVFFYNWPNLLLVFSSVLYLLEIIILSTFKPCKNWALMAKFIIENIALITINALAYAGQQRDGQPQSTLGEVAGWTSVVVVLLWGLGVAVLGCRLKHVEKGV